MRLFFFSLISLVFSLWIFPSLSLAQTIKGKIVSLSDKEPIAYATVKLKGSDMTTRTNDDGEFYIEKDPKLISDTLIISNIGYFTLRIATGKLPKNGLIVLKEDEKTLKEVGIRAGKKRYKILNEFNYSTVLYNIEKDTAQRFVSSKFPIAKTFTADVDSFKLESIHVGRYVESMIPSAKLWTFQKQLVDYQTRLHFYDLKKHTQRAIFNLYVIYPNSLCKPSPLSQAFKIKVDINNQQSDLEIDLRSYNIRPKQRDFYVAVEWLTILPNQNYSLGVRGKSRMYRQFAWPVTKGKGNDGAAPIALIYESGYEPFVAIYKPKIGNATQKYAWIQNKWLAIKPDATAKRDEEIALSAKISYYQQ